MVRKAKWAHYPPLFREKAIVLGREIGPSHAGDKLGIERSLVCKWMKAKDLEMAVKKDPKASAESKAALEAAAKEIRKLKRENDELKKANYVLKEVASFFSKDPLPSSSKGSLNSPGSKKK